MRYCYNGSFSFPAEFAENIKNYLRFFLCRGCHNNRRVVKLTISSNIKDQISVNVIDEVGRAVETRIAKSGQTLQIGDKCWAGIYFAQTVQGNKRVTVKPIKQAL